MNYKTIARCPVCRTVFDEITHPGPEMSGMGGALLLGPERRKHALVSPSCTADPRWIKGWDTETKPISKMPLVDQFDDGIRPAGPPDRCFYCFQQVGQPHSDECYAVHRKVKVRYIFEIEVEMPYHWDEDDIESHRNESSWCASNGLREIIEQSRQGCEDLPPGEPGCICQAFSCEYVGETDGKPYNKTVDPEHFRKSHRPCST